jgi:hypothetical protein
MPEGRLLLSVFLMAFAILMHEILLTRIFSVTMFYHFAFMAISIAMFGLTAGAVAVFTRPRFFPSDSLVARLSLSALLFSLTVVLSLWLHLRLPQSVDGQSWNPVSIAATYAVISVPYFFGGVFMTIALTRLPLNISRIYAADLAGASLGCFALVWVMKVVDGLTAVLVVAAVGALSAALIASVPAARRFRRTAGLVALAVLVLACLNGVAARDGSGPFRLIWVKGNKEPRHLVERWNSYSRLTVHGDTVPQRPLGDTYGPNMPESYVPQLNLDIDAQARTVLTRYSGSDSEVAHLRWDISNLVHYLKTEADVLVVGVGGGRDILSALAFEQRSVLGVEINEGIVRLVNERFGDFTGHLDRDPRVTFVNDEARSYIARTDASFDIIQISMIDTWAATAAGAFVFTENALYTRQAWDLFLRRLNSDGILSLTRWYSRGLPGEIYRLAVLATTTLRSAGIERPREHIMLFRHMLDVHGTGKPDGVGTMLVSKTPFTAAQRATVHRVAGRVGFEVVLDGADSLDPELTSILEAEDTEQYVSKYAFDISAPTDDDPFFFQMLRPAQMLGLSPIPVQRGLDFNTYALQVLWLLLVTVGILTALCILVPLVVSKKEKLPRGVGTLFGFFGAIGLGFMFIEISQLQRLNLFLGHPTYATSVALSTLLLSGGLGSYGTSGIQGEQVHRTMIRLCGIVGILVIFGLVTPSALAMFEASGTPVRIIISGLLLFPMGFFMGMAFPLGMKLASRQWADGSPWLWGVNGAASVLASVLAVMIAIMFSIPTVFWLGVVCYIAAAALFARSASRPAVALGL